MHVKFGWEGLVYFFLYIYSYIFIDMYKCMNSIHFSLFLNLSNDLSPLVFVKIPRGHKPKLMANQPFTDKGFL